MLKILVVENDKMFAQDLVKALKKFTTKQIDVASTSHEAIAIIDTSLPDMVFIDIDLDNNTNGIDVAKHIKKTCQIPFIYLTDFVGSSNKYFKEAQDTLPSNYIPKGEILPQQIWHFAETALDNYSRKQNPEIEELKESNCFIRNSFFARSKEDYTYHQVSVNDINYLEVKKPYLKICTKQKKIFEPKISLERILEKFNAPNLIRVHQSYAVHLHSIAFLTEPYDTLVLADGSELPIGRTYLKELKSRMLFLG